MPNDHPLLAREADAAGRNPSPRWALLLPWVLLAAAGLCLWWWHQAQERARAAARNTFRPRAKGGGAQGGRRTPPVDADAVHLMSRREVHGLRDAFSSAAIDPAQPLWVCAQCQALYHASSLQALREHNEGRCTGCGHKAFATVRWHD